jgi:coatomer subunit beta
VHRHQSPHIQGLKRILKASNVQGDTNSSSALDVVFFVREIMETNPKLRPTILARLLDTFSQIRSSRVCSCALWILSEYCTSPQDIHAALEVSPV